jgi:hypothetical protein
MIDRKTFFERVERVFGSVPLSELSDDALIGALTVAQYASDMALVEAERRGLTGSADFPFVPFELPEGVDMIETVLTRPK